ncbi:MAG: hypothetical protein ABSF03_18630 [Streptosporangiaceae bacterium]|jgi:hypothetical protein
MNNNNKGSAVNEIILVAVCAYIGYQIGKALEKYPWLRAVFGIVFAGLGVWATVMAISGQPGYLVWTAVSAILAALLIHWSSKEVRVREAASARFAALQAPADVSRLMVGNAVNDGPLVGWKVQTANIVPNTFRTANGQVYADVDITLTNGTPLAASFHADTNAGPDAWEWFPRTS